MGIQANFIAILPPSVEVLEERLIKRGKDDINEIKARMLITAEEIIKIETSNFVKEIIINDNLDNSYEKLKKTIIKFYPYLTIH